MKRFTLTLAAVALALLLGLQPVTTDLYLPALPAIKAELHASMHATQLTMAALLLAISMVAISASYLVSARVGRRRG